MACAALLNVLALAVTATFAQNPVKWTNLYVKWGPGSGNGSLPKDAYYKMPLNTEQASKEGWTQAATTNLATIWCLEEDPRVCMLYDFQGTVAGLQISLPVADFVFAGNDSVDKHPLLFKNNMYNTELYSARYYLVDEATLAAGGRPPSEEVGTGLWLQSGPDLVEVPRDGDLLEAQSWTYLDCVPAMGKHYYHNVSKETACEDLQPFILLLDKFYNSLHGLGFVRIGTSSVKARKWFEFVPPASFDSTPNAPFCLKSLGKEHGVIALHMYFIDEPWSITC